MQAVIPTRKAPTCADGFQSAAAGQVVAPVLLSDAEDGEVQEVVGFVRERIAELGLGTMVAMLGDQDEGEAYAARVCWV